MHDEEVVMHGSYRHRSSRPPGESGRGRSGLPDRDRVASVLAPTVAAMGMDLESVLITPAGRRRLLRVVVDADGGVSLDDIALLSRELSARLDGSAVMGEQPYTLEVSSPGVDRPLTEPRHWRRAIGRLVATSADARADGGPRSAANPVAGRVTAADENGVTLDVDGESRRFAYHELGPGRIQIEFAPLHAGAGEGADEEGPSGY
jgi:ribosome maturation factor RimP